MRIYEVDGVPICPKPEPLYHVRLTVSTEWFTAGSPLHQGRGRVEHVIDFTEDMPSLEEAKDLVLRVQQIGLGVLGIPRFRGLRSKFEISKVEYEGQLNAPVVYSCEARIDEGVPTLEVVIDQ